ncbi:MAG TPA: hypothetical protein VNC50_05770 [Planctomycetia bacterium]|nr:hypothetical protein [Planctomycetia bacterium]
MKLGKILVYIVLVIAGLVAALFGLDLAMGWPFGRGDNLWTDIFALLSAAFIIWQAVETLLEFKTKKR